MVNTGQQIWTKKKFKYLRAFFKSLRDGATISRATQAANISRSALYTWRKKDDRLNRMIEKYENLKIQMVEDSLIKNAVINQNVAAQIFYLKNRAPDKWRDKHDLDGTVKLKFTELVKQADTNRLEKILSYVN